MSCTKEDNKVDKVDDTNLCNYSVNEILQLFKLPINFNDMDLLRAKRTAMRMHPDSSNLPSRYFEFFSRAYGMIERLHDARTGQSRRGRNMDTEKAQRERFSGITDSEDAERMRFAAEMSKRGDFDEWFNASFEKTRSNKSNGYDEWLRRGTDEAHPSVKRVGDINEYFESRKSEACARFVSQHKGVADTNASVSYCDLDESAEPDSYSSGIFQKLQYEDLHKAHTENFVPVCTATALKERGNVTLERYKQERVSVPEPLKVAETCSQNESDIARAYAIARQDDESRRRNDEWWALARGIK